MYRKWSNWLGSAWGDLVEGRRVIVPRSLPHPGRIGFERTSLAEDVGQIADWSMPVKDGSRLHVHEFRNMVLVIHRDTLNPDEGLLPAIGHFILDTDLGKVVTLVGGIFLVGWALSKK